MLKTLLAGAVSMLALDIFWIGFLGSKIYQTELKNVARYVNGKLDVVWYAAVIVYLAILFGLYYFVFPRVSGMNEAWRVFVTGGLFGMTMYLVYDFTNLAVIKNWTLKVSIIDGIWGFVLCGTVTTVMWWVSKM